MSQDYTKRFGNQIRDKTLAGVIANIIRAQQQSVPLFQGTAVGGLAGSGGASGGACGITINPTGLNFVVPTNDVGSVAGVVTVTSSIAQSATFSVTELTSPWPSCLGTPTVTPSTVTFTAGQSAKIAVSIPYTNCTDSTITAQVSLTATTSLGCTTGNLLTGGGNITVSNAPTFALEVECTTSCPPGATWGSVAYNSDTGCGSGGGICNCPEVQTICCSLPFSLRLRSINGFSGTVTLSCDGTVCQQSSDCLDKNPTFTANDSCSGFPRSYTLTSGQTLASGSVSPYIQLTFVFFNSPGVQTGTTCGVGTTVIATSGGITTQAFAQLIEHSNFNCGGC